MTKVDALINEIIAPAPEFRDANILAMESTHDGVQDQMRVIGRIQKTVEVNLLLKKVVKSLGSHLKTMWI